MGWFSTLRRELEKEISRTRQEASDCVHSRDFWVGVGLVLAFGGIAIVMFRLALKYDRVFNFFNSSFLCSDIANSKMIVMIFAGTIFPILCVLALGEWANWTAVRKLKRGSPPNHRAAAFGYAGSAVLVGVAGAVFMNIWC